MSRKTPALLVVCLLFFTGLAWTQEARGTIAGRITDSSNAVIPEAKVTISNTLTNQSRVVTTNATGYYEVGFLDPSTYRITVEASGFKRLVRSGIDLPVGTKLDIPLTLEVGGVTDTVSVTAEAPLLETSTASGGRVLDQRQLVNLPFSDLNPFALSALAPGMQWTGQPEYRRPFDNGGTSAFNANGGVGQNEYSMDGMSVTGTGRRVGFVPPADSITEFKLETSNFDASQGFTSGAAVNVVSKSGTNELHGALFDQHWQQRWNATPHFSRLRWEDQVRQGRISPDSQKQATGRSNNYGFSVSGPVWIPKIFNGKNKYFWTVTWNGIKQAKAETTDSVNRTVPTPAERQGDFSALLNAPNGANLFTIYDPRSARLVNGTVVRTPFPGNMGVPILNPMYQAYVKLYPAPNNVPGLVTAEGTNNYLAFAMPKNENFNSIVNRFDVNPTDNHRFNFRWQWNDRLADEYDWTYETARGLHTNGLTRINKGINFGYLYTISPTNIFDFSAGFSRFEEGSRATEQTKFKPTDVGLPAYLDARAGDYHTLPRVAISGMETVSGGYPVVGSLSTMYAINATMTTIHGSHSWRYGWQGRRNDWGAVGPGNSSGSFDFGNNYVRRADNDNVSSGFHLGWAAFMMGMPTGISIDTNGSYYFRTPRHALFFQDDWRITSRFRVQLGLRYEYEGGTSERYNQGLAAPFLPDLKLPITDLVQAAYAANPRPELPASQFRVMGGTSYLGQNGLDAATKGTKTFLPKVGVVYSFNQKTVLRAGWGMYSDTFNVSNTRPDTTGYSLNTGTPITNDNGLTFCCGLGAAANLTSSRTLLADPFPVRADGTRFNEPLGNALGSMARVGRGATTLAYDFRPALQHRWRIGVQREMAQNLLLDVSYNGAYSLIPVAYRIDALPGQYWSTGNVRNQANDDRLNTNVPNPYSIRNLTPLQSSNAVLYNYLNSQGFFTGANIRLHQLLRPFSHMNNASGTRPGSSFNSTRGNVKYHDLQILLERRFTKGLSSSFMYTWASSYVTDWVRNEFDTEPSERLNNNVRPHRIAWTATYELPWGKGRTWLKQGPIAHLVGNWNTGVVYQWQPGPATGWGNRFFYGDLNNIASLLRHEEVNSKNIHQWFDGSIAYRGTGAIPASFTGFEGRSSMQPGSYHVNVFPSRLDVLREPGISNWDLKLERAFPITESSNVRFAVDFLNALNHTNFSGPNLDPTSSNFGRLDSQRGLSRVIQLTLRVEF
jgi:carboxypeptidase family protein/TonB-dependent receptor-like protein